MYKFNIKKLVRGEQLSPLIISKNKIDKKDNFIANLIL